MSTKSAGEPPIANIYTLSGTDLTDATITPEQLKEAKNTTLEQLTQIKPSIPATLHEATTAHPSVTSIQPQIQPAQTSQEEAKQQGHKQPKQDTDAAH